jgi:hypothetical protein
MAAEYSSLVAGAAPPYLQSGWTDKAGGIAEKYSLAAQHLHRRAH